MEDEVVLAGRLLRNARGLAEGQTYGTSDLPPFSWGGLPSVLPYRASNPPSGAEARRWLRAEICREILPGFYSEAGRLMRALAHRWWTEAPPGDRVMFAVSDGNYAAFLKALTSAAGGARTEGDMLEEAALGTPARTTAWPKHAAEKGGGNCRT